MTSALPSASVFNRVTVAAFTIGVALSGFFDGIMLHQVLQWHHLLSLVPGEAFRDLRTQVLFDGLFHICVYLVTALGLWLMWRAHGDLSRPGSRRSVIGGALLGFGAWNIVDVGFFHWVLGIHRIRVDVSNPMAYDLAWIIGLGVAVAAVGWWVIKRPGSGAGRNAAAVVAVALVASAPIANMPVPGGGTLVIFRPDIRAGEAVNAILASNSKIIQLDPSGRFGVIKTGRGATASLYRSGAIVVSTSPILAGCLAFVKTA